MCFISVLYVTYICFICVLYKSKIRLSIEEDDRVSGGLKFEDLKFEI